MEPTTKLWIPVIPPPDLAESLQLLLKISPEEARQIIVEIQEYEKSIYPLMLEENEQRNRL